MIRKTLYEVLGIRKNANPATIRRAYRKLSMLYHADRNPGDDTAASMYHAVTEAYAILSDPDARKRYDETGDTSRPRDTDLTDIAGVLIPVFAGIVNESIRPGGPSAAFGGMMSAPSRDIRRTDLVSMMMSRVRDRRAAVMDQLTEMKRCRGILADLVGRTSVPDGAENIFESTLRADLEKIERPIADGTAELKRIDRALEYLKSVKYRRDDVPGASAGGMTVTMQRMFDVRIPLPKSTTSTGGGV